MTTQGFTQVESKGQEVGGYPEPFQGPVSAVCSIPTPKQPEIGSWMLTCPLNARASDLVFWEPEQISTQEALVLNLRVDPHRHRQPKEQCPRARKPIRSPFPSPRFALGNSGCFKEHNSCQRPLLEAPITLEHTPISKGDHVLMTETSPWED